MTKKVRQWRTKNGHREVKAQKSAPMAHKKWTSRSKGPKKCANGAQKMDIEK
jgi:hypothetical protein